MKRRLLCSTLLIYGGMLAADAPMKEGLWSIHTVSTDQPGNNKTDSTVKLCRNHAYDDRVRTLANEQSTKSSCKISENTSGNTTTSETECAVAKSVLKTKGTVTIVGDTAHSESHTTYTPAMYGTSETTMVMDQKYLGPCPAGVEPGDRISADGKVQHTAPKQK